MTTVPTEKTEGGPRVRPWDRPITPNERLWVEIIRLASWDSDPAPTLNRVQRLRQIFDDRPFYNPRGKVDHHGA